MKKNIHFNYAIVLYDIGEKRVQKVFKICKKYFKHHQKSVFRGNITPANLIALRAELNKVINKDVDFITIFKFKNQESFEEETIGIQKMDSESIFI